MERKQPCRGDDKEREEHVIPFGFEIAPLLLENIARSLHLRLRHFTRARLVSLGEYERRRSS